MYNYVFFNEIERQVLMETTSLNGGPTTPTNACFCLLHYCLLEGRIFRYFI